MEHRNAQTKPQEGDHVQPNHTDMIDTAVEATQSTGVEEASASNSSAQTEGQQPHGGDCIASSSAHTPFGGKSLVKRSAMAAFEDTATPRRGKRYRNDEPQISQESASSTETPSQTTFLQTPPGQTTSADSPPGAPRVPKNSPATNELTDAFDRMLLEK